MAEIIRVPLAEVLPDPANARKVFTGIKSLADSIRRHGLKEPPGVRQVAGKWVLNYGERRLRAMRLLVERGDWPADVHIACIVCAPDEAQATWDGLIENFHREDVPSWQMGAKLSEALEQNPKLTQPALAATLGISQGSVSRLVRIARGLHPEIVERLNRALPEKPADTLLVKLSTMVNLDTLEPDLERQRKYLDSIASQQGIWTGKRRKLNAPQKTVVYKRFSAMRSLHVPAHAEPYYESMMNYLSGAAKRLKWPEEP